jgi:hypothetical protein
MDTIVSLSERLEVLQNQVQAYAKHTRATKRRLHCWRRIAHGLMIVGLVSLPMASGTAQDESSEYSGIRKRLAALEYKLQHITSGPDDVTITGANLRIVNGLGDTETTNGLGNLIVGYNEPRPPVFGPDNRTGSHNVVVGKFDNFSSFGGLVVGFDNEISGRFSSVSGGGFSVASGDNSSVNGGASNTASGDFSSISGGGGNTASGRFSWVSGGFQNTASGENSSASGGESNKAVDLSATVSGGVRNTASGQVSSVSGGFDNTASERFASVSGGGRNTASGPGSSVSGGFGNTGSGDLSSVSGGSDRTAPGLFNWAAGPLFADN